AAGLRTGGVELLGDTFFDTVTAVVDGRAAEVVAAAAERGVNLRAVDSDRVGIACDETTTDEHLRAVWEAVGVPAGAGADAAGGAGGADVVAPVPAELRRTTRYLRQPVFSDHHSETAMLRYLRRLSDKDYALDRGMIPLGSCTMKLNATTEMEPITWPEFADL